MPIYRYRCPDGHRFERHLTVANHQQFVMCQICDVMAEQVITAPTMVKVAVDVRYTSPIDDTPITSHQARIEDMKRHNCREYDPEEKTDFHNRQKQMDAELDASIDATVEEAIEKMPTKQRGELYRDLVDKGATTEYARSTPDA